MNDQVRSALFVDFDNIFLTFNNQDTNLAKIFATTPERWLQWLLDYSSSLDNQALNERRIITRRCYMNPESFSDYRPYFTKAAFEVIDCPPLTSRGKTSTDINMVMDILETLHHYPNVSEYIILSGDADFTPVLIKLRKHDRRTSVFSAGYASPAYRAAADNVIDLDKFIHDGLCFIDKDSEPINVPAQSTTDDQLSLLRQFAERVMTVITDNGAIQASDLPKIYREVKNFRDTNWLGFGSLKSLSRAVVDCSDTLIIVDDDPWRIDLRTKENTNSKDELVSEVTTENETEPEMQQSIEKFITGYVRTSLAPVPMSTLAQYLTKLCPSLIESKWFNSGSFKSLLLKLNLPGIEISPVLPGFLFDPLKHESPENNIDSLQIKIHNITDTPLLSAENYKLLFSCLAKEINENGYNVTQTSKAVRDCCAEEGTSIARSHINFVLQGLLNIRFNLFQGEVTAKAMAEKFFENVLQMCRSSRLTLTEEEIDSVKKWILSR